ncbi:MAG TPA: SMP-30/gluconolactonase/LRE family protein [Noviherbaspirillum sp.]|nr:SMP-30/gluconolactonase/LRE family protein [Noviherbaspirillum sp.]
MRRVAAVLFVCILLLGAYLSFAPVPIEPLSWAAPKDAGYVSPHEVNTRLANLKQIDIGAETGPEHIVVGPDGALYAAVDGGKILRLNADGSSPQVWAQTGGRVLGFDFDRNGNMIAADAIRGLLLITHSGASAGERKISVLADKVHVNGVDDPIRYADAVVVAKDGKIFFTDASRRFGPAEWGGTFNASVLDIMEHSATGRVLVHDPADGSTQVVADGLSFANGIALSADERWIFVAETGEYRIWKFATTARKLDVKTVLQDRSKGHTLAMPVVENIPGYPDNLMRGMDGRIWVGLAKPRSVFADKLADSPALRKAAFRLPKSLWPVPPAYGHVFAIDENGKVIVNLQDPSGQYPETTGVTETADRLYIQSLHAKVIGWMPKAASGL